MSHACFASALVFLLVAVPARAGQTPEAPPQYADRFVTVSGLRLHYLEWGSSAKPAMVLLHGIARHAHTFDHIAREFARGFLRGR